MAADPGARRPPPQVTMGLLDYVTTFSLDQDYATAAARPRTAPARPGRRRATMMALLLFGLLLATAAAQTARTSSQRATGREALVGQVVDRREELAQARRDVVTARNEVATARADATVATAALRRAEDEVTRLGAVSGTVAVHGPGVRIVVDDNPDAKDVQGEVSDKDLQRLVNGLWVAGAEAVSVNGQRVTSLTAIREAGESVTVNFRSLRAPYTVLAVGDPDTLPARFVDSPGGTYWLDVEAVFGLRFDMDTDESLHLPGAPEPSLRYANQPRREEDQ